MSSAQQTSTQGSEHPLMNKIRQLAYKVFARETAERVLHLVGFGYFVVPYKGPKQPGVSSWRDLQDVMLTEENLLKAWKRATVKGTRWYGVLLGRTSQHLVLIDIDSVTAEKLLEEGKEDEARRIVQDLYSTVQEIVQPVAEPALGLSVRPALFTRTRRGVHILLHIRPEDYSKLDAVLGKGNIQLRESIISGHKVKIELRIRGATPLQTEWHETKYDILPPPPVSLQFLKRVLEALGVRLPIISKQECSSAVKPGNGNRDVQNPTKSDEEAHTPTSISKTSISKSSRETPPVPVTSRLSEQHVARIVDLLKNYWVPGHRNNLQLGLVGWLIKRGVSQEQAEELVRRLAEAAGDEEVQKRIDEVRRQYKLVELGQKQVEELLGKTGLLQELQQVIKEQNPSITDEEARDRALSVVSELEKILGPRRSIIIRTGYETGMWFVNDPARGIVLVRERTDENGQVHRHRKYISDWYVRKVLVVRGDGQYIYKVLFKNARTKEKLVLAGSLDEIVKELKRLHGVKRSQHLGDAVSAIISEFIRRKMAKVKKTAAVAGILPVETGVKLVRAGALSRLLVPKEVDVEKARQALKLLEQLREHYDPKKFDVAINWAAYAPASYALKKHYHVKQVYLLLHGEKQTGKTTLARIITAMFPIVTAEDEEIPEEGQSEYRLAWKLNVAATPVLEDEVQGISRKPGLLGLLKRASTGDTVRWRGDQNRKYHARAPLVFTSNYTELIEDPALIERIIGVEFTQADYVFKKSREQREEFRKLHNEYRAVAHHLGAVLLQVIVEHWQDIAGQWAHRLQEKTDYLELGQQIWRWVAEKLQVEPLVWTTTQIELEDEEAGLSEEEIFWEVLREGIREAIARYAKLLDNIPGDLWTRINVLADRGLLPAWMYVRRDGVIITAGILREMERYTGRPVIGGLHGLAAKLCFEYKVYKVRRRSVKGMLIPYKVLIYEVATREELAKTIEDEILFLIKVGKLRAVPQDIVDYIRRRWGVDEDTAYQLMNKILDTMEDSIKQVEQEEAVA